jgi:hypothetical protein
MVTYCTKCGASLPPTADVIIRNGKEMPSPYYKCPACNQPAGEAKPNTPKPLDPKKK